jgi:hypothetical protein
VTQLSLDAKRLRDAISGGRKTRWALDDVEAAHLDAVPHMRSRPERRRELGALIQELADGSYVRPSVRRDTTQMPALPAFVDLIRAEAADTGQQNGRGHGWRPELAAAMSLRPAATSAELRVLRMANRWLAERAHETDICGSRERSLEVFGNEKLLDEQLRYGRLFASDILSYGLLRARRRAPGLVTEQVGDAPTVLVVENSDTFRTLADIIAEDAGRSVGVVAWGAGAAFEQSCDTLQKLTVHGQRVQHAWYFGDIDPSGLRIPARAAKALSPLAIEPARGLYALLFELDRRVAGRERMTESTDEHLQWLGAPLASQARDVMAAHRRLPQEALAARVLRERLRHDWTH